MELCVFGLVRIRWGDSGLKPFTVAMNESQG
jgi:hypothetical protein